MALPASGQIDLGAIRNEFKASSGQIALSELYRGGTYVPPLTINAGVPTSGQIDLNDFYSSGVDINIPSASYTVNDWDSFGFLAIATVTVYNNADFLGTYGADGPDGFTDTWCSASSAPGAWYQVKCTVNSGSLGSGSASTGTWLDLSSDRTWNVRRSTSGTSSANITIEIRCKATGTVKDSCTVALSAAI